MGEDESARVEIERSLRQLLHFDPAGSDSKRHAAGKRRASRPGTGLDRAIQIKLKGEADLRIFERAINFQKTTQDTEPHKAIRSVCGEFRGSDPHSPAEEFAPLRPRSIGFSGNQKERRTPGCAGDLEIGDRFVGIDPEVEPAKGGEWASAFRPGATSRPRRRRGGIQVGVNRNGTRECPPRRRRPWAEIEGRPGNRKRAEIEERRVVCNRRRPAVLDHLLRLVSKQRQSERPPCVRQKLAGGAGRYLPGPSELG